MRDAGDEAPEGEEDPQDLARLANAAHHHTTATLASGTTFVLSSNIRLQYDCRVVGAARSASAPDG